MMRRFPLAVTLLVAGNGGSIQILSETKPRETVTVLVTRESLFVNGTSSRASRRYRQRERVIEPLRRALQPIQPSSAPMIGRVEGEGRAERSLVTARTRVGSGFIDTGRLSSGFCATEISRATRRDRPSLPSPTGSARTGARRVAPDRAAGPRAAARSSRSSSIATRAIYALYGRALREQPELQGKVGRS